MNTIKHLGYISLLVISYNAYGMKQSSDKNTPQKTWGYTDYQEARNNLLKRQKEDLDEFNCEVLCAAQSIQDPEQLQFFLDKVYSQETYNSIQESHNKELKNLEKRFPAW